MYRRDDEKLHCRDGEQAEHFSASQGAEQAQRNTTVANIATEKCNMAHFLLVTKSSPPSGGLTKM